MSIENLISYEISGVKETFADWISNISPEDTPFVSLTGKFPVNNKVFEWQTDRLDNVNPDNAWDGGNLPEPLSLATKTFNNYTQILRKVVRVSDTANSIKSHGHPNELEYQIEKASKEIKRDLETILLSRQIKDEGNGTAIRLMSAFYDLTAGLDEVEPDTGAVTHKKIDTPSFTEEDIFDVTYNLYLAGSRANIIMYHPTHADKFSDMFENPVTRISRVTMFEGSTDTEWSNVLTTIRDPLGQVFTLIPNRLMSPSFIYFFHPHDWFQMVLRSPDAIELAKNGSYSTWLLEMEVGLQHRNPFASGILELPNMLSDFGTLEINPIGSVWVGEDPFTLSTRTTGSVPTSYKWSSNQPSIATVDEDTGEVTLVAPGEVSIRVDAEYGDGSTNTATVGILVEDTVKVSETTEITMTVNDVDVSVQGFLAVLPQVADDFGYDYEITKGSDKFAMTDAGIITPAVATNDGEIKITSRADTSITTLVKVIITNS